MSRGGGRARRLLLAAAMAACWLLAVSAGLDALQIPPVTSLRYGEPALTVQRADEIRRAQARQAGDRMAFTAWEQLDGQTIRSKEYEKSVKSGVLLFSGDLRLILNPRGMNGMFSSSGDAGGCALDTDTAYRLWGSDNVVGQKIEFAGEEYAVRAVFRSPSSTVLIPAGKDAVFSALSLDTRASRNPSGDAESFYMRYGLAGPEATVSGGWITGGARLLMLLPALAMGLALLAGMLRELWAIRSTPVLFGLWCVGIAGAAALGVWASGIRLSIPQSLIPTRWSDFEFWSRTVSGWWQDLRAVFASPRLIPDMVVSGAFGRLAVFGSAATVLLSALAKRAREN